MIQVLHKFYVREHLNKQHVCVLDRKKMSFCRAGLGMAKTNRLVDGKNLGNWQKKFCHRWGFLFKRVVSFTAVFVSSSHDTRSKMDEVQAPSKEHSFMFFCSFLSFLFIFTASFSKYQVWIWYNKWFEPRSEVWLCSLIISFIHQVCLGGWASAQTSSSRYRYVDVLKIALNIEKKQHHFGLLLGVEDTVDVKQ